MKSKVYYSFLKSIPFRIVFPICYGLFLYSSILLIFDTVARFQENFFSLEALILVIASYFFLEGMNLITFSIERWGSFTTVFSRGLFLFISTFLAAFIISTLIVWIYFWVILGLTTFSQELTIFNSLFIISAIFYDLVYLSFFYLNERNSSKIEKEGAFKAKLEWQFERFRGSINPAFLYQSLETLISLVHTNPQDAQEFIGKLANFYRYLLEHQSQELITLSNELEALENQAKLLNEHIDGALLLSINVDKDLCDQCMVIPGSLQRILGSLVASTIVNQKQPLQVNCTNDGEEYLIIQNTLNEKISPLLPLRATIKEEQEAYLYFTSLPLVQLKAYNESMLKIPLLYTEADASL